MDRQSVGQTDEWTGRQEIVDAALHAIQMGVAQTDDSEAYYSGEWTARFSQMDGRRHGQGLPGERRSCRCVCLPMELRSLSARVGHPT
jgi:hypothetical protein